MNLLLDRLPSPIGTLLLVWSEGALRTLDFGDNETRFESLLRMQYGIHTLTAARAPKTIRAPIEAYFEGELTGIDNVPVETKGTPFQQQVWKALREIPAGSTTSYGEVARRIGRPEACRAVGLANGSNPVSLVVPCHRVIGASGALTGYGGGIDRKRWLLDHERALQRFL